MSLNLLIVIAGGLARGLGPAVALPFAVLVIFAGTFARIYGQAAQQVGTLLCIVLVLSLDHAQPSLASAATLGGFFFLGGAWATVVTRTTVPSADRSTAISRDCTRHSCSITSRGSAPVRSARAIESDGRALTSAPLEKIRSA